MAVLVTQGNTKRRVALRQTRNIQTTVDRAPVDQVYPTLVQLRQGNEYNTFEFPFPPANLQYTNLTPEWVEVNRPGYVPLTGLAKYNLMRIQFEFLLAAPFDGIKYSVEEELNLLRNMANSIQPVYFSGMDSLTNTPIALPGASRTSTGMFFRITDFTITSMRRNPANQITAAQCSMALQEDFSLAVNAVTMPAIEYPPIMKPRIKKDKKTPPGDTRCPVSVQIKGSCDPCLALWAAGISAC
jgi:hypothetical protein